MAFDYERITLLGSCQPRDAELRFTASGTQVLSFSFVCKRSKRNKDTQEWEDESDWFRVSAFGQLAERFADKALKGARLLVSGRFSTRPYTNNDGADRLRLEIAADSIVLVEVPREHAAAGSAKMPQSTAIPQGDVDDSLLPF